MSISVRAAVGCCAALTLLTACGSDPIDTDEVEQQIKAGYERQIAGATVDSVTCPKNLKREPGVTATCRLTLSTGVSGKVDIAVREDKKIEWKVARALRKPADD
ncbi:MULTISPECIES: DUF4333 domain-containing protein [Mumia]|uniref:DUF4333 domain-containing protein n=1 Tax=Mumia TaxID=1546255 RepID=UPI001423F3B4|nr:MULTISPECIES: DUF4333 domain-containing protein [unclassified Mumia]QMW68001.1 DUF4333 domain-containing protein [Mumia sp. ZJ1417]